MRYKCNKLMRKCKMLFQYFILIVIAFTVVNKHFHSVFNLYYKCKMF